MVKNLEETGTPFDYKGVDFKPMPKKHKKDQHMVDAPPLLVGYDSNPDKNQIYIEKDKTFEDE